VTAIADTDALQVGTGQQSSDPEALPPTSQQTQELSSPSSQTQELSPPPSQIEGLPPPPSQVEGLFLPSSQPNLLDRIRRWVSFRFRPANERRLDILRVKLAGQLSRREQTARQASRTMDTWSEAADSLLSEAEVALRRSDVDTAWSCFEEAMRMDVFAYDSTELAAAQTGLRVEATEGLNSWRGEAITRLLAAPDQAFSSRLAKLVPDEAVREKIDALLSPQVRDQAVINHIKGLLEDAEVSRPAEIAQAIEEFAAEREQARKTALYVATGLRNEHGAEETQRLLQLRRQLLDISGILTLTLVGLLLLATSAPIRLLARPDSAGDALWGYVALFGALGGGLSAFRSFSGRARLRLPVHLLHGLLTAARPLLGAIGALAAYVLLQSGVLAFRPATTAAVLLVAFFAGFAERLVVQAVEPSQVADKP
jgi:hypothetical protein